MTPRHQILPTEENPVIHRVKADLLQGRVSRTVFAKNYFTPSVSYRQTVLEALNKVKQAISK
jgi:hypothetical protein